MLSTILLGVILQTVILMRIIMPFVILMTEILLSVILANDVTHFLHFDRIFNSDDHQMCVWVQNLDK